MPTLYVENVPKALYEAIRARAKSNRRSIAAEVITVLEKTIPTPQELRRRARLLLESAKSRNTPPLTPGPFPSAEEMVREDRER